MRQHNALLNITLLADTHTDTQHNFVYDSRVYVYIHSHVRELPLPSSPEMGRIVGCG